MIIIPAIDIIQERVVRLRQGDFSKEKFYSDDPVKIAHLWKNKGAKILHLIDLEGARSGHIQNGEVIGRIIKDVGIRCEVGGGVRDGKAVEFYLQRGAWRVILGTTALEDMSYLKELISRFGEKLVVSLDFVEGHVAKTGWLEKTDLSPREAAQKMESLGVKTLILTDIVMDGTLMGPHIERIKDIIDTVSVSVIISGGISNLDDIRKIKALGYERLEGVIVGRALYEGKIELEDAIRVAGQSV